MTDYIYCIENVMKKKYEHQRIVKVALDVCLAHSAGMVKSEYVSEYVNEICKGCTKWHEQAKALGRWPLKKERKRLSLEPVKKEAVRKKLTL